MIKTTHYIGNFVYENAGLSYILSGEGIIVPQNGKMVYQYYMKDHLGNNRVVFDQDNLVVQNNVYFPFGMLVQPMRESRMSTTPNLYLYNGKELQDDFELDWYDYGARFYDAQIGRWHSVDPLAEDYPSWTPYHYVHNNPINLIDQTGMSADWIEGADGEIKWDENATSQATTKKGETYLGKAVVVFEGSKDEKLGKDGTLQDAEAKPAKVTVYGTGGADDINTYDGLTMTSDPTQFSVLDDGWYDGKPDKMSKDNVYNYFSLTDRNYKVDPTASLPYRLSQNGSYLLSGTKNGKAVEMKGVFFHRINNDGNAGMIDHYNGRTEGCPVVHGANWPAIKKQLGSGNIKLGIFR